MKIYFKTKSPYFEKERDGLKCNTVREIGEQDSRFDYAMVFIQSEEKGTIVITNPKTDEKFERELTDITYYGERFIFSWKDKKIETNVGEEFTFEGKRYKIVNHKAIEIKEGSQSDIKENKNG